MRELNRTSRARMAWPVFVIIAIAMLTPMFGSAAGRSYKDWVDVAAHIDEYIEQAYTNYVNGDPDAAYKSINDAYYVVYETTGMERVTMGYISGAHKTRAELAFSDCKSKIRAGVENDVLRAACDTLSSYIHEDAQALDDSRNLDENAINFKNFLAAFLIILREGFEAILVVGAIIAYLVKSQNGDKVKYVYIGSLIGIAMSFVAAWLLNALKLANQAPQEVIEGVTALIAVCVLFYVSNWMVSKSESAVWSNYIDSKVSSSVQAGSMVTLGFTAFLAVFREGAEVILFYQPLLATDSANMVWIGFAVGCVALVAVYLIIRFMSIKLPIKPFFLGTSILMFLMSISFLGSGIKELIEGNVIDAGPTVSWIPINDTLDVLGIYPNLVCLIPQLILLAITIVTFVIQIRRNRAAKERLAK